MEVRRILMVAPFPFCANRGSPINVLNKIKILLKNDYYIDLICYPEGENIERKHLNIYRPKRLFWSKTPIGISKNKIFYNCLLLLKAIKLLKKHNYDVIHGHEIDGVVISIIAKKFLKKDIPIIYDMHSLPIERVGKIFNLIQHFAIKNSNLIMGISPNFGKYCLGKFSFVFDVPIKEKENINEEKVVEIREKFGTPIVFYMGTIESYQGFIQLDKVWDHSVGKLMCYTNADIEFENAINIKKEGYSLSDAMVASDVLISPRQYGSNIPLKIYPYMRSGKPIVATDIPAHSILTDNVNCVKTKPDPLSIMDGIKGVLESEQLKRKIGDGAKKTYEQMYNMREYERRVIDAYKQIEASS
ncbi:MAG TPA: hypothetical protein ENG48_01905 [Candidatus Atribacteria bacterium]|nr:hypothetical protein [Candidatus Atribacteria bacterium]